MIAVAAALAIYAALAWSFREYTPDDTFIFIRYAENWASGRGLVFNIGERVQGYTSPLWTLLIALAASAGLPALAFAKTAGAMLGGGCIVLAHFIGRRIDARAAVIAPLVLAGFIDLPYWSISGMDAALFAFITAAALLLTLRAGAGGSIEAAALAWGLAGITRPEGVAFGIIALVWLLGSRSSTSGRKLAALALFIAPIAAWTLFASSYYGGPLPNTYWAKRFDHVASFRRGLVFLRAFLTANDVALIVAALALAWFHRARATLALFALLLGAEVFYLLWTGGDSWVAPGVFRFAVPLLVPLSVVMAAGCSEAWGRLALRPGLARAAAVTIAVAAWLVFPSTSQLVLREVGGDPAIVEYIRNVSAPTDAIAVTDIGQFAWRTDLPVIDTFGLTDAWVASLRKYTNTTYERGEDLKLADYLMGRAPRWIILKGTAGPGGLSIADETGAPAIHADTRFRQEYRFVMAGSREPYLLFERSSAAPR